MSANAATINYDRNQTPSTFLTGGAVTLNYNDTLQISIGTGFPSGVTMQVTSLNFYNVVNGGKGNTREGNWSLTGTSSLPDGLSIVGNADGSVTITDTDTVADKDYYYNCNALAEGTTTPLYAADPVLVVRKKIGTTARRVRRDTSPDA